MRRSGIMALIKCPECGKEISDKAKNCPSCGCKIKSKIGKRKIIILVIALLLIIGGILGGWLIHSSSQKKELDNYQKNISKTSSLITDSAASIEESASLLHDVWNNAIQKTYDDKTDKYTLKNPKPQKGASFEEAWNWLGSDNFYDYSTAVNNLLSDEDFMDQISKIKKQQGEIEAIMKNLKDVPKGMDEEYQTIKEYYDIYLSFTTLVTDVEGSLDSWTSSYNDISGKMKSCQKKVKTFTTK